MHHQYWFKPKTYGYGAVPNTWEGWLSVAVYVLVVAVCAVAVALHDGSLPIVAISLVAFAITTAVLIAVGMQKTDGGWRWRWGSNRISGKND